MKEYNALLGQKIDLNKAKELLKLALSKEQLYLANILKSSIEIAEQNGIEIFEIVTPFIEQVKSSFLSALEQLPDYIDTEELEGLNASVTTDDIYTMITNKLIERIKIVSSSDYKKKWNGHTLVSGNGFLTPMNFVSKKAYRGINFFMLKGFDIFKVFKNPYFLTFKQIQGLKGKLKKGSKGHEVVYFTMLYKIHLKDSDGKTVIDFGTYNKKRYQKYINDNWNKISQYTSHSKAYFLSNYIPIIKYYNVFNGEDIEGIDFKLDEISTGKLDSEKPSDQEHQLANAIVENYPKPQPGISHGGDQAAYMVDKNSIVMPHPESFVTIQDYYRTLFHELTHNSGDIKHLDREIVPYSKDRKKYAFEELIAEFGAVFLSAQAGFLWKTNKNHAAYIKGWNSALTIVEEDNRFIMRAASAAQKASDYILNLDENGDPAYYKDLEKQFKTKKLSNPEPTNLEQAIRYTKEQANFDLESASKAQKEVIKHVLKISKKSSIRDVENLVYESKNEKLLTLALDLDWIITFLKDQPEPEKKEFKNIRYTKEKFMTDLPSVEEVSQSYRGMSFSSEKRGKSEVEDWGTSFEDYFNKMLKLAQKRERVEEFKSAFNTYYPRVLKRKLAVINARSSVMSTMITGRGGYPVARQKKIQERYDDRLGEYFKYMDYMQGKISAVVYNKEVIKSGESETLAKLKEKLAELEDAHATMLLVNKVHREWIKKQDDKVFKKHDFKDSLIKQIKSVAKGQRAIPSYMLSNSRQNINATKKRIEAEKKREEKYADGDKEVELEHFTILENVAENRLQIYFNDKPSEAVRTILKKTAFRWSNKNQAWQRQLTSNAIYALKQVMPKLLKEYESEPSLNAPWHEGKAKEALTTCGRLKPGYKYKKGGKIVKIKEKKKAVKNTTTKAKKEPVTSIGKTDTSNRRFSMKDIKLDEKRFQNRSKLNEEVVSNIVNNFKATDLDPLVIWLDPKDKKHYLLAGHHRYEALRRLKRKTAPVRIANNDYPIEKDAIRYARELSNANRTLEQAHERAVIYRKKIKEGITKVVLEKEAAIEGRNRSFVLNLAHLSERGKALQAVIQFANSASIQDKNEVDKIADWLGQARRNNSELSNAHENEMFDFLRDSNASKRVTNKAQFLQLITSTTNDMFFEYTNPLNLKRFKYQSEGEKQYDQEVEDLRNEIATKQKSITDIQDRFSNPNNRKYINADSKDYASIKKTADNRVAIVNEEIRSLQRTLQDLYRNKGKYTNAGSNQAALFGAKPKKKNILNGVTNILAASEVKSEFFTIPGAVGEFLQQVEKKPVHSVVVTLDGAQGAGKTTTMYRFIDSFASAKKPCVFFSLEEHPQSHLAREKASQYIDKANVPYVDTVGDLNSKEQFYEIVDQYDFIFIDSWQKLQRAIGNIRLDEDLRKRFNGKVFIIIFQQTTTGRTKGGAEIVFDGDIIIKMVKEPRFQDNYAYMDKNRYTLRPIDELRYNIAGDYIYSIKDNLSAEIAFDFQTE